MKKILKVLIVIMIILIGTFIATRIYYNNVGIEPNDLYLNKEYSKEMYKATKGSYSWNDKGMSVIADSVSPVQMDFSKSINVNAGEKLYFSDENWTSSSAYVIIAQERTEMARIAIETNLEQNYITVPELSSGEYLIQINLESNKGDVWYATKINIIE